MDGPINEQKISWRIYHHGVPQSFMLTNQLRRENKRRYAKIDRFETDIAGPEGDFPAYVFIEPQYLDPDPNDDHPPYDLFAAQKLIARIYNGLRANEALWNHTLLVVLYDEHGGFYDHVRPPSAVAPDTFIEEYSFDRLGVRVPALLISPWVRAGVCHLVMDHTSLLRIVSDRWKLKSLGRRVDEAQSFADVIQTGAGPRTDTPRSIPADPPTAVHMVTAPGPNETTISRLSTTFPRLWKGGQPRAVPRLPRRCSTQQRALRTRTQLPPECSSSSIQTDTGSGKSLAELGNNSASMHLRQVAGLRLIALQYPSWRQRIKATSERTNWRR